MNEEKRRFQRYYHPFEVEYSPKGNGIIYSASISKNISKGGICLPVLSRLVRTGDPIKIDIYPDNDGKDPVSLHGEVMWTRETTSAANPSSLDAEAGIRFVGSDESLIDKLLAKIPSFESELEYTA